MSEIPSQNPILNLSSFIDEASLLISGTNGKMAVKKDVTDAQISALLRSLQSAIPDSDAASADSHQILILLGLLQKITGVPSSGRGLGEYVRALANFYSVDDTRFQISTAVGGRRSRVHGFGEYPTSAIPRDLSE